MRQIGRLAVVTAACGTVVALALGVTEGIGRSSAASSRPPGSGPAYAEPAGVAPEGTGDVSHLTPAMKRAVDRAIAAAAEDGVELRVTSGWRSRDHQAQLYAAAIAKYGSAERARRWVLPPDESAHVRGEAVDIGPPSAARWLDEHGVRFGLCRRYANESWHFERLAAAKGSVCPAMEPHP